MADRNAKLRRLDDQHQLFCQHYVVEPIGKAAAIKAGYSEKSAKQTASTLLKDPRIQGRIAELQAEQQKRLRIDADRLLLRLTEHIDADVADLFDDQGRLLPANEWPHVWRTGLVVGIESFEEYQGRGEDRVAIGMVRKIRLSDRIKHIELAGKHVAVRAFRERVEHDVPPDSPLAELLKQISGTSLKPKK